LVKLSRIDVNGHKLYVSNSFDCQTESLVKKGVYEEFNTKFIKKNVREGDVVLDIGANIGYFTLICASLVGKTGKVFAFEPEPKNFEILKKNVTENGYDNVILENMALSNRKGIVDLYLSDESTGMHRIYSSKLTSDKHIKVNVTTLDEYFQEQIPNIAFIKLDVEGSEFGVLQGMKSILNKNRQLKMILEYFPDSIKEYGTDPKEIINFLDAYNFKKFNYQNTMICVPKTNFKENIALQNLITYRKIELQSLITSRKILRKWRKVFDNLKQEIGSKND